MLDIIALHTKVPVFQIPYNILRNITRAFRLTAQGHVFSLDSNNDATVQAFLCLSSLFSRPSTNEQRKKFLA